MASTNIQSVAYVGGVLLLASLFTTTEQSSTPAPSPSPTPAGPSPAVSPATGAPPSPTPATSSGPSASDAASPGTTVPGATAPGPSANGATEYCFDFSCSASYDNCLLSAVVDESVTVPTCDRNGQYRRINRKKQGDMYFTWASCVTSSCEQDVYYSPTNGLVSTNCCSSHLCNTEYILPCGRATFITGNVITVVIAILIHSAL